MESVAFICKLQKSSREEERRSESPSVPLSLVATAERRQAACVAGGDNFSAASVLFFP